MKDIKDDINRSRDIPCCWTWRVNIFKMTILPKANYRFNAIAIKIPKSFLTEQKFCIFMETHKKTLNSETIFRKKNEKESDFLTSDY